MNFISTPILLIHDAERRMYYVINYLTVIKNQFCALIIENRALRGVNDELSGSIYEQKVPLLIDFVTICERSVRLIWLPSSERSLGMISENRISQLFTKSIDIRHTRRKSKLTME